VVEGDNAVLGALQPGQLTPEQGVVEYVEVGDAGVVALDVEPDLDGRLVREGPCNVVDTNR